MISIHAPAKGATLRRMLRSLPLHFNPRSREGSDCADTDPWAMLKQISIHAPAKGATKTGGYTPEKRRISIHAPAKGATLYPRLIYIYSQFQSTLPRRERRLLFLPPPVSHDFNPRSREGSDTLIDGQVKAFEISIHAPAKGATLFAAYCFFFFRNFNPRSREGSDDGKGYFRPAEDISIHAPAKGATPLLSRFPTSL